MTTKMVFHGSDIEKICAYYHLNKEDIVKFGANVNPLGLSASVKKEIAENMNIQKKMTVEVLISCSVDFVFMCGNIMMKSGVQKPIFMKRAEARISRAITKKKLLQRFCHGRI